MRSARLLPFLLGVLVVLLPALSYAEQNLSVRVCIAGYDYGQVYEVALQQQAKALTSHKPDKTTHITTEGIPVPALKGVGKRQPGEKLSDIYGKELAKEDYETASKAGCDYALFSLVTDASREMGPSPSSVMPGPRSPHQAESTPEISVIVVYRLQRINPPALVGEGSIPVHAAAPRNAVVADGLNMAANQAFQKIAKDPQIPLKTPAP